MRAHCSRSLKIKSEKGNGPPGATGEPFGDYIMKAQQKDTTAKLAHVEASMRRWHTRLTRASNMLQKLERQRRRLALQQMVWVGAPRPKKAEPPVIATDDPDLVEKVEVALNAARQEDPFAIPPELNRADPFIAEKMTAARKKAEAAARKAMPLTGRAASDYIKAPRKRKA